MSDSLEHSLRERVKELTALHRAARLLLDASAELDSVMSRMVALVPPAWQYPFCTECRVRWGKRTWATAGFRESPWSQIQEVVLRDGATADLTVVYTAAQPEADEGPFLREERDLIRSLADLLRAHLQHRQDDAAILAANARLEGEVAQRTADLRRLARELCLTEERERRLIAQDLHDHLGQGLALIKLRLQELRGNSALGGHDRALEGLVTLSDQAIRYTRGLTFELSPPLLYELGLGPALDWLGESLERKHGLKVKVKDQGPGHLPDDLKVLLWKCARELAHNVVKHADARKVVIFLAAEDGAVVLEVGDDGRGFDPAAVRQGGMDHFGLFSIEERLRDVGGQVVIAAAPGRGARVRLTAPLAGGAS